MEIAAKRIAKMDMVDMTNRSAGALWPLFSEADNFTTFADNSQGLDRLLIFDADQRRKLASELLEVLESAQIDLDEHYSGWLEEPMDLEVFGQSLEQSSRIPLDEVHASYQSLEPSSPLVSEPSTPLAPTSPQDLYPSQDDRIVIKTADSILAVPDNEELLESLESLLHQFNSCDSASVNSSVGSPEQLQDSDDDIDTALLDSLITEDVDERQLLDELAEFSMVLMQTSDQGLPQKPQQIEMTPTLLLPPLYTDSESHSACSTSLDNSYDSEPPRSRRRGRKPLTVAEPSCTSRKARKKNVKPEEKRLRKKEQNKTAATRYRMKKRAELDLLLEEEEKLEQRNRELQGQYDDLANEIRYLKKLFREVITGRPGKRL